MALNRRHWLGVAFVLLAGLGTALWLGQRGGTGSGDGHAKLAPAFELPDASGKTHRLEDLRGNVVVLHFWATWCPPCLEEIGHYVEAARTAPAKNLKFVAISLDESWAEAHKILPEDKLPRDFLSLIDLEKKTPDLYGSYQYPETYLIGGDGRILHKWVGPQEWNGVNIRMQMAEALRVSASQSQ